MHLGTCSASAQTPTEKDWCMMWRLMCCANWLSQRVRFFLRPAPHKDQIASEGESQGRHRDTGGGFTRKHDRRGRTANSRCILDRQRRLPKTWRDHVRSASALSALKSLVANLSAKRQLSVAKLSAERIFSLAKRDFLVANGRMAADFSSPAMIDLDVILVERFALTALRGLTQRACTKVTLLVV